MNAPDAMAFSGELCNEPTKKRGFAKGVALDAFLILALKVL